MIYLLAIAYSSFAGVSVKPVFLIPLFILLMFFWQIKIIRFGLMAMLVIGVAFLQTSTQPGLEDNNIAADFRGVIVAEPVLGSNRQYIIVEGDNIRVRANTARYPEYFIGEELLLTGNFLLAEQDPYYQKNKGYFLVNKIRYTVSGPNIQKISLPKDNYFNQRWYMLRRWLVSLRKKYEEVLLKSLPQPYAGLSIGILLGSKNYMDEELYNIFITIGIVHIMALSGYNITVICKSLEKITKKGSIIFSRYGAFIGIWAFVAATGFSSSVVRAALMGSTLLVARMLGRQSDSFVSILLAAAIMVGLNPYILRYDIGFQLSFVAMVGMIFLAPKLEPFFSSLGKRFSEIFSTTIAAQIFTLPLLSYTFGRISWVAIIANVLILPLIPACMALTFIVGSVGFTSVWLAQKVSFLLWLLLGYVVKISKIVGSIPAIDIQYQMSWPLLLGLYLVMIELILLINLRSIKKNEEN